MTIDGTRRSLRLLAKVTPHAYIDRIPNEIFELVFSFLPSPNHGNACDCSQQLIHQFIFPPALLIVRWVSRRFRIIANECRSADILDFFQLSKHTMNSQSRPESIKMFLNDAHFVNCLSRQSDWKITNVDIFLGILSLVPSVAQNARRIDILFSASVGVDFVIRGLGYFTRMTELNIDSKENLEDVLDLDIITTACPTLERLKLWDLHYYRGTLQRISTLQSLNIRRRSWPRGEDYDLMLRPAYIPFDSGERLTTLVLGCFYEVSDLVDVHVFDHFPNLIDLEMFFLVPETSDLIINGNIRLTRFVTDLNWPGFPATKLLEMLSAPSLSSVKDMWFSIEGNISTTDAQEYLDYLDPVISAVTDLPFLRDLYLRMGLRKTWCQRFARLLALKSLCYDVNIYQYGEGIGEVTGRLDLEESHPEIDWMEEICLPVRTAFENAFVAFPEKPRITI